MRDILERLSPGDHTALFYRNRAEQFAAAIPYIQIGLARHERCLYIAGDNSVPMVVAAMEDAGIDVARAQQEGQLTVATPDQTYLKHGVFEPEKMIEGLMQEIEFTLSKGFSVFRGTGELGWASALPSALLRLYEYEEMLDSRLSAAFIALCQYNETLFSPELLGQMLRVHPKVLTRGRLFENPFYQHDTPRVCNYPPVTVDHLVSRCAAAA